MKQYWREFADRFNRMQRRERLLIALALIVGVALVGYTLAIEPQVNRWQQNKRLVTEQNNQLITLKAQLLALNDPRRDPEVMGQAQLATLKTHIERVGQELNAFEGALVPPQKMTALLESLVVHQNGIRLVSLKTLPVNAVIASKKQVEVQSVSLPKPEVKAFTDNVSSAAGLYSHGVQVQLEGDYASLTAYLQRLEQQPLKLLWSDASVSAQNYPKIVLTMTVYTLSMDRAWLVI